METDDLEMRYDKKHMELVYQSQLKNRYQKPNEARQQFEVDVAQLVQYAYPIVLESLDGLRDVETQQPVKLARPRTLDLTI